MRALTRCTERVLHESYQPYQLNNMRRFEEELAEFQVVKSQAHVRANGAVREEAGLVKHVENSIGTH
jgi:hypothetical protein